MLEMVEGGVTRYVTDAELFVRPEPTINVYWDGSANPTTVSGDVLPTARGVDDWILVPLL
jgi:hypothetical protein